MSHSSSPRSLVLAALVAAAYAVAGLALAPLGFGPLQLRLSSILKPLCLATPGMSVGIGIGVALTNLLSPFGFWDSLVMPLVTFLVCRLTYALRACPPLALVANATLTAAAVATFPLHIAGGFPIWPTVALIATSELALQFVAYHALWRTRLDLFEGRQGGSRQ